MKISKYNGGEDMRRLIREFQWSSTVGQDFSAWPPCIRTVINTMVSSPQPMWVGYMFPHLHFLYNDAYIPMLGDKHAWALGQSTKKVCKEIWELCEEEVENLSQGKSVYLQNFRFITKSSTNVLYREEYANLSIIPVGDGSQVFGVLCIPMIITDKVQSERRFATIKEVSTLSDQHLFKVYAKAIEILSHNREDIPFALLYHLDSLKQSAILQNNYGIEGNFQIPATLPFDLKHPSIILSTIISTFRSGNRAITSIESGVSFGEHKVSMAIFQPIFIPSQKEPIAVLAMGVNPCCELDDRYSTFFEVITVAISSAIRNSVEGEKKNREILDEVIWRKNQFFSDISLGLRIPVSLILSPIEELLTEELLPIHRTQLELVHHNAIRLRKLVNSLLELSCLEAGEMRPIFELTDLPSFTFELTNFFRSIIERGNLSFYVITPPLKEHEKIYVDREMWEKIVLNLLSNAFKFTTVGSITLRIYTENHHFILSVADTGVGVPAEEIPFLFERFKRVVGVEGRTFEGTGIGLTIVRELVKLHRGSIEVQSELGMGSVFKVLIPLGLDHLPVEQIVNIRKSYQFGQASLPYLVEASRWITEPFIHSPGNYSPAPTASLHSLKSSFCSLATSGGLGARILIVDDNADIREYIRGLLELEDYCQEVIAIDDGELALQIALSDSPDLILTDVRVPKLSGLLLLKYLRENQNSQTIPVILLSSCYEEGEKIEALKCGADDFILKPFTSRELTTRVETLLKIAHTRKVAFQRERDLLIAADQAKNRLSDVVGGLVEGFIIFNRQYEYTYVNDAILKDMRKTRSEVIGRRWQDLFPDIIGTSIDFDIRKVMEENVPVVCEFYYPTYDNYMEFRISPHPQGICIYSSNATARWKLAQEKDQAVETANTIQQQRIQQAEEYRRKQSDFIDCLCHAIRNPLNGIYGGISLVASDLRLINAFADRMSQRVIDDDDGDDIQYARQVLMRVYDTVISLDQCAKQQKVIVDDVLCLSKLDNKKVELNCSAFKVSDTVRSVLREFEAQVSAKKLHISTHLIDNYIRADNHYLHQVISNLYSNAVKFTPDEGTILLVTTLESNSDNETFLQFSITDSGVGMNSDELQHIFDRFGISIRKSSEFGSGLGLTLCKLLVELMGGSIHVTSEPGKGSHFVITIRCEIISSDEAKMLEESKSTTSNNTNHNPHCNITPNNNDNNVTNNSVGDKRVQKSGVGNVEILIVDDNSVNRKIISRIMEQKGYKYATAKNGKEAFDLFIKQKFDLIFMDVEMPVIDGIEATKLIRENEKSMARSPPIPIIGVSGNGNDQQVQCGLQAGMNAYLIKPYEKKQVCDMINKYIFINRKSQFNENRKSQVNRLHWSSASVY